MGEESLVIGVHRCSRTQPDFRFTQRTGMTKSVDGGRTLPIERRNDQWTLGT